MNATYKEAGVDLEVYRQSMQRLPRLMHRTFSPRVRKLDGGFAGLFQLDFASSLFARKYQDPVLVSATDGVGTKLKVAHLTGRHDTVGIDLVAMSVNDAICCGAEPLFFLDYVAMSHDDPTLLEQIVSGVSDGCVASDCALLGGETAIMGDLYRRGEYDLAGFCVGVVERKQLIDGKAIAPGDRVIGIGSNGFHSNGYSLIRKVVFDHAELSVDTHVDELDATVGDVLMRPTEIYAAGLRAVLQHYKVKNVVHGVAHITGGGLQENLGRILPGGVQAVIDYRSWEIPACFPWLQRLGEIDDAEMDEVFNMGLGLVMVVSEYYAAKVGQMLSDQGLSVWDIGSITEGGGDVVWSS